MSDPRSYRKGGPFQYQAYVCEPILPDKSRPRDEDVVRMTQEINDLIEEFIRAHPKQWNWTQPRWKVSERMRRRSRKRPGAGREADDPQEAPQRELRGGD